MTNELKVVNRKGLEAFDRLTLNTEHRLDYESGDLTAVFPAGEDVTEYQVALFPVEDGTVELPSGSAVLSADETVLCLVPTGAYDE